MSVLLLDMDSFKTRQRHARTRCRRSRAAGHRERHAKKSSAISDVAARIGGEEFAMLLPDTDRDGAIKLAQRLRRTINEQIIADAKGAPIQVTASIGVATMSHADHGLDHILTHADRALYRAKDSGRNQVCTE